MKTIIEKRYHLFLNGLPIGFFGFESEEQAAKAAKEIESVYTGRHVKADIIKETSEGLSFYRIKIDSRTLTTLAFPDKDEATQAVFNIMAALES